MEDGEKQSRSSRENQRRETSERDMAAKREGDEAKVAVIQLSLTKVVPLVTFAPDVSGLARVHAE